MLIFIGLIIVIVTIYLLIKQYETRMILCASGFLMSILSGKFFAGFDAFAKNMIMSGSIETICSVMGFAYVMKLTECDKHLIHLLAKVLLRVRPILIPAAVIATFCVNMALPSAAGTAAAVGAILIPILISAGIHPAIAGAAILSGLWGSLLNPGNPHNPFIAKIANIGVMDVIAIHHTTVITTAITAALALTIVAKILKEDKVDILEENSGAQSSFHVNPLYAMVPLLPLTLLVIASAKLIPGFKVGVPQAMLIGSVIGVLLTRKNPAEVSKSFFDGMGSAYSGILGIIISAGVFVAGMTAIGLVDKFTEILTHSTSIVKVATGFGSFLLAVLAGSGDAAGFAFNGAITPQAEQFGLKIANMGSVATLAGAIGHKMSPIGGSTIICAGLAGVNPFDLAKRNAPGMVIATIVAMIMLF
ncbi:DcuC family C4-dicarboxylate transporter [Anaerospora hongkongensis]|uniref:DcuC family C4-dicarboxylate transporter n=1 Tax=Anaerospora hongkongensis TaxID=244830 RepID=A0A4R1Q1L6_9FIRM|nr:C4-dicarboxylate transporter DcuC [Anaerospora hongkongensis]TCL38844.1 DcuC family C4-dicarboxylate transporter [Anaerospora hongkongensis]